MLTRKYYTPRAEYNIPLLRRAARDKAFAGYRGWRIVGPKSQWRVPPCAYSAPDPRVRTVYSIYTA